MTLAINLTIKNSTGCTLNNLSAPNPQDGSYDSKPASSIAPGGSTTFKVVQNNALSPGPQGHVTYDLNTGPQTIKVQFNWRYDSGAQHTEEYSVAPSVSSVTWKTSLTDGSGDTHANTYEVFYTEQPPRDWDMVWALSVGVMNSQLEILMDKGLIPYTFTQSATPGAAPGSDAAWEQLIVSTMDYPSVQVPDSQTQHLDIHLPMTVATLQYLEGGARKTLPLSGNTVIVSLDLSQQQINDVASLATTSEAKDQLNGLRALNYGVYRIFADLRNPSLFRSLRVVSTASGAAISLSSAAQSALQKGLAGTGQLDIAYPVDAPGTPALLVPTQFAASTTQYTSQPPFSSLNVCMMTRGRNQPVINRKFDFTAPVVPTDSAKARMLISQDTFGECYLSPVVLKIINDTLSATVGAGGSLRRTDPLTYQFTASKDNGNLNDGRGVKVAVNNGFDQYVLATESAYYKASPDLSASGHQVTIHLSGQLQVIADVSQYPLDTIGIGLKNHLGTSTYTQPWTATITVSAGDQGKLITKITTALGSAFANEDKSISGYVTNFFNELLGWTTSTPMNAVSGQTQQAMNDLMTALNNNLQVAPAPEDCVVLPTGAPYYYANMIFNGDGVIQIDVTFPG
jgi:hypothetical protein